MTNQIQVFEKLCQPTHHNERVNSKGWRLCNITYVVAFGWYVQLAVYTGYQTAFLSQLGVWLARLLYISADFNLT